MELRGWENVNYIGHYKIINVCNKSVIRSSNYLFLNLINSPNLQFIIFFPERLKVAIEPSTQRKLQNFAQIFHNSCNLPV